MKHTKLILSSGFFTVLIIGIGFLYNKYEDDDNDDVQYILDNQRIRKLQDTEEEKEKNKTLALIAEDKLKTEVITNFVSSNYDLMYLCNYFTTNITESMCHLIPYDPIYNRKCCYITYKNSRGRCASVEDTEYGINLMKKKFKKKKNFKIKCNSMETLKVSLIFTAMIGIVMIL